jgi:FRG domain
VRHTSAAEFLRNLSPTNDRFGHGDWLFRGQSRDLPLLPTAFRDGRLPPIRSRTWTKWTNWDQARAEFKLIHQFYSTADRAGLAIPEDSYDIRLLLETIEDDRERFVAEWPPGRLRSLIALAQHHGVVTRLLDFTHSPWVAAYFAAESVLNCTPEERAERLIVVWAFDAAQSSASMPDDEDTTQLSRPSGIVEVVTTPYANNRNLAAQRGIHLLYRSPKTLKAMEIVQRNPLDDVLQHVHATVIDYTNALYKFTLPATEAGQLLRLVAKYGVTGATMFPGFDGVARAMRERRLWGFR